MQSNHPPLITKRIPQSIQKRLSTISCSKKVFDNCKGDYNKALREAGHKENIKYQTDKTKKDCNRKRRRKVIWFNPPYNVKVLNNVGKRFLSLVSKHFPADHKLHKIFNRNTLKISYSCMPNMATRIKAHNKKILSNSSSNNVEQEESRKCNCRNESDCPVQGKCLLKNVIYKAQVKTEKETKSYIGQASTTFKIRYTQHKSDMNIKEMSQKTSLSKYVWQLKDGKIPYTLKWSIIRQAQPYTPISKRCNLCLWEKYHIIMSSKESRLNSRNELVSKCRHRTKHLLSEFD